MIKTLSAIKRASLPVLKKAGIREAAIFGSFARGEQTAKSDVDVLIRPPNTFGLFELVGLRQDLAEALDCPVDVVSYRGIHPRIKPQVMKEAVRIL